MDESVTLYVDAVGCLEKRLAAAGQLFQDEDKIQTILPGLPEQFSTTRDLVRERKKKHHDAVAMLVEKKAERGSGHSRMDAKKKSDKLSMSKENGLTGTY